MPGTLNGIDISSLMTQIDAVRRNPALGDFTFKCASSWEGGFKAQVSVTDIRFGGEVRHHKTPHELHSDMPECMSGEDTSFSPLEMLLSSLAACLMSGYIAHGTAMSIHVQKLDVEVTGEGDLAGFYGVGSGKSGITNIHVKTKIKSTASAERLQELHRMATTHSPVWDTLTSRVNIDSKIEIADFSSGEVTL